jgi:multiple sugar transport system permease protein
MTTTALTDDDAVVTTAARHRRRRWGDLPTAFWFLLPSLLGFLAFMLIPLVASFVLSFTNWQLLAPPQFVGLDNYVRALTRDPAFWQVLTNTLFYTVEYLVLNIVISLVLAVWIASVMRGKTWFRVIFFLPTFTPMIAASVVWLLIFMPDGLLDYVIKLLGLAFPNFLLDQGLAMQAVIIVSLWGGVGYNMVLFNAALDLVPQSYLDAAKIDGANAWQRFWGIRLPLISPTVFFGTVMTAISSLQVFDNIYAMTGGGPGMATATLGYAIYDRGFGAYQMGYASALSWVMFVMIMALTGLQFFLQKKWVSYDQ